MTLAETLMDLDAFYCQETTRFAGSPLLLQVMFPTQPHIYFAHITWPSGSFFLTKPFSHFSLIARLSILYSLIFHPSPDMVDG